MKARVKSRPEPGLEFTEMPQPKPGANGVLVRVSRGCCAAEGRSMSALHEARFYETLPDSKVLCTLCATTA